MAEKIIYLKSCGINKAQAIKLCTSLATFSKDWNSPEMSIYDNYDTAKANRKTSNGKAEPIQNPKSKI